MEMKPSPKYDVFLSYRREGGQETALLLYERLTRAGYRVAFDLETLRSGRFDEQLLQTIASCKDVLVILGPHALDRCSDRDDWVRQEIACALRSDLNVIPLLLRGFAFPPPDTLPEDIRDLAFRQGVEASMAHFDSTLQRLEHLLRAKPVWFHRRMTWIMAAVAGIALLAAGLHSFLPSKGTVRQTDAPSYPSSRTEIQQLNEVVAVISRQAEAYQEAARARSTLVSKANRAVQDSAPSVLEAEIPPFRRSMAAAIDKLVKARPPATAFDALRSSPIPTDVYGALFDVTEQELHEDLQRLPAILSFYAAANNPLSKSDRLDGIDRQATLVQLKAQGYALGIFELFQDVAPSALSDFRKLAPTFTDIPRLSQAWPPDKEQLEIEQLAVTEQLQKSLRDATALAGKLNLETASDRVAFEQLLVQSGISSNRASELAGKIAVLASKETDLAVAEGVLSAKKATLYTKFKPLPSDDPGILWSKALRFRAVHMEDAAIEALAFLAEQESPDFRPGAVRAMEAICKLGDAVPFDSGVMVSAYEPPATSHAVFQPGDVIVARDESPIRHVADWKTSPGSSYRFWRLDGDGVFHVHEADLPPEQPRVGLVEIAEPED
jgi:hypothetical protein